MRKKINLLTKIILTFMLQLSILGCSISDINCSEGTLGCITIEAKDENLATLKKKNGEDYVVINNNVPNFTKSQKKDKKSRIELSKLDSLGRCGPAVEIVSKDMLPKETRKDIHEIRPSGWHQEKYGSIFLYNRTHLLAYMISGLNDEPRNLITGTQHMNQDVMEPFELQIRDFVRKTGYHVYYRVTPHFLNDELVARGVQLEAWSIEDNGKGLSMNVYLFNDQPGVAIDYETGYTSSSDYIQEQLGNGDEKYSSYKINVNESFNFIVNKNNGKFHLDTCSFGNKISLKNREEFRSNVVEMESNGYEAAGCCIQ